MLNENAMKQLENRVLRLEHENRLLRWSRGINFLLVAVLVGVGVLQYNGWDYVQGKTVSAESFLIKDDNGIVRAELGAVNDVPRLALFDDQGNPRAAMAVTDGEPGFHIYDDKGFRRAVIGLNEFGPRMVFMDRAGFRQTGLVWMEDGQLGIYNAEGAKEPAPMPLYKSVKFQAAM